MSNDVITTLGAGLVLFSWKNVPDFWSRFFGDINEKYIKNK